MAAALFSGTAVIGTTGTAVQLRSTANTVSWFNVIALLSNEFPLKVGPSTVTDTDVATTDGYLLAPGETVRLGPCETDDVYINGKAKDRVYFVAGTAATGFG